jgi:broad specificity phosphatase PhoE
MKSSKYCTIYLVRHGRTDWNDKKIIQGHTDTKLNSEGQSSAKDLAKVFKNIKFDKIYSSDLSRARETAEIIALEHKLVVETTKALRERHYGNAEGKSHAIFKGMNDILDSLDDKVRYSYKFSSNIHMESDEEVMNRFLRFLREIAVSNSGKTILIATHAGPIRMFLVKLGIMSYKKFVPIENLGYVKLESDGVDFFVKETSGIGKSNL